MFDNYGYCFVVASTASQNWLNQLRTVVVVDWPIDSDTNQAIYVH